MSQFFIFTNMILILIHYQADHYRTGTAGCQRRGGDGAASLAVYVCVNLEMSGAASLAKQRRERAVNHCKGCAGTCASSASLRTLLITNRERRRGIRRPRRHAGPGLQVARAQRDGITAFTRAQCQAAALQGSQRHRRTVHGRHLHAYAAGGGWTVSSTGIEPQHAIALIDGRAHRIDTVLQAVIVTRYAAGLAGG